MGYLGAASEFDEGLAKKLKLSRTDLRCLDLVDRLGPLTAGRLAEESGLTTGAGTFILDRLEEAARARRIADFIARMTDRYALAEHARLFDSTPELR